MIKYRSFQVIGQKKNFPLIINKSPSSSHTHDNQKFTAALHQAAVRFDRGKKLKDLSLSTVKTPTSPSLYWVKIQVCSPCYKSVNMIIVLSKHFVNF